MLKQLEKFLFYPTLILLSVYVLMGWTEVGPQWHVLLGTCAAA